MRHFACWHVRDQMFPTMKRPRRMVSRLSVVNSTGFSATATADTVLRDFHTLFCEWSH